MDNFFQEFPFYEKEKKLAVVPEDKGEFRGDCFKYIYIKACLYVN